MPERDVLLRPSIGPVQGGCLSCPPKPGTPPMDWQPHPGFGRLTLTRDGETLPEWHEWQDVTLGEIEAAVATDPGHDWRLRIDGPMGGAVYQRHGCKQWVPIERLDGFA